MDKLFYNNLEKTTVERYNLLERIMENLPTTIFSFSNVTNPPYFDVGFAHNLAVVSIVTRSCVRGLDSTRLEGLVIQRVSRGNTAEFIYKGQKFEIVFGI